MGDCTGQDQHKAVATASLVRDARIRNEVLQQVYNDLKVRAPHLEVNTGPEHDIGYANGYWEAMNRVLGMIEEAA